MSSSLGIGSHSSTAGLKAPLLNEQKGPTRIVLKRYVPLTEREADLYMKTKGYYDDLLSRINSIFFYLDLNNNKQPMLLKDRVTEKLYKITEDQAMDLIENYMGNLKKQDKITLKTKGIGYFPEPVYKKETSKAHFIATTIIWFPCLFPCSIFQWIKLYKHRGEPRLKGTDGRRYTGSIYVSHAQLNMINVTP